MEQRHDAGYTEPGVYDIVPSLALLYMYFMLTVRSHLYVDV